MATCSFKGVEYEFLNTPQELLEELKCSICLELVSAPVQTSCGHLFCGRCITRATTCPIDRNSFTTTPDHFNERRVHNFKVKCPNRGRGCQWQGDLVDAKTHKETNCGYVIVACTNSGCGLEIERRQLEKHRSSSCAHRKYNCPYCFHQDTYQEITTTHFTRCPEMPLPCPGGCGRRGLVRRNVAQHLTADCPGELVACTYAIAGCQEIVKRKNLKKHLKDKDQHLDTVMASHLALSFLVRDILTTVNSGSQQKVEATRLPLAFRPWLQTTPTCYPRPPWVIKMEGFQEKKENDEVWYSDPVYSHIGGYKMCLKVHANGKGNSISMQILLMTGDNDDNLKWPFKGTITVSLLNQLEDGQHHTRQLWSPDDDISDGTSEGVRGRDRALGKRQSQFISHHDLDYKVDERQQFLKDNTLFFRVDCFGLQLD